MRRPLEPKTEFGDEDFLHHAIKSTKDAGLVRRLQAILYRMQGKSIMQVLDLLNIHRDTLHDWVRKWNKGGVDELRTRHSPGRPRKLGPGYKDLVIEKIEGSLEDGRPYTAIIIEGYLKKENPWLSFGYSTLCRNLNEWGLRQLRPRPKAEKADPVAQASFVENVNILLPEPKIDFWSYDESAALGDPYPYLVWALKGSRPTVPYLGQHLRITMAGAVRPADGYLFAMLLPTGNRDYFQVYLNELNLRIDDMKRNIMIIDNAPFHHAKGLDWGNIEPMFLPPYSPELNPIEELWLIVKKKFFRQWCASNQEELENRAAEALNYYIERPRLLKSACAMSAYF